jgi:hypothetical protein
VDLETLYEVIQTPLGLRTIQACELQFPAEFGEFGEVPLGARCIDSLIARQERETMPELSALVAAAGLACVASETEAA